MILLALGVDPEKLVEECRDYNCRLSTLGPTCVQSRCRRTGGYLERRRLEEGPGSKEFLPGPVLRFGANELSEAIIPVSPRAQ